VGTSHSELFLDEIRVEPEALCGKDVMATKGVYLVGFSGSGKSTIAQLVGARLGWPVCDLDSVIVERSGLTIPVIFKTEGEAGFRAREADALREVSSAAPFVVATGGGTFIRVENRRFMESKGWIIALEGRPEILLARIEQQVRRAEPGAIRPLLDAVYPLEQVRSLKHSRQSIYALADWTVHTDRLSPDQVVAEVIRAVELLEQTPSSPIASDRSTPPVRHSLDPDLPPAVVVAAGPLPYRVVVGWQNLPALGEEVRRLLPHAHQAATLSEAHTWGRLGSVVTDSLTAVGLHVHVREVASGEPGKTWDEAIAIYDWLLNLRLRRDDILLVVGGGAIDDLGGFVASTYMRGVPLVKVPTSLECMVDGAIGGKTALNHPRARNLIGTFYEPWLVWSDAALLREEPPRERRAAWAEVVKYAMLEGSLLPGGVSGPTLFEQLERTADALVALDRPTLLATVARCVALKAEVVSADERDLGHHRVLLNYGHTVGHALETAMDYTLYHGDAVAIGMTAAARLAGRLRLADSALESRQSALLCRFGLPTRLPPVSHSLLLELIHRDKKVFGDAPRWVLPTAIGRAVVSSNVSEADLIACLEELSEEGAPAHS
jgi:shikimate kinase/3-dehydroquinate synthase